MYSSNMVIGRLGQEPQLRTVGNNQKVINLNIAEKRREKNGDQWKDATVWHQITVWGGLAERLQYIMRKGSLGLFLFKIDYRPVRVATNKGDAQRMYPHCTLNQFYPLTDFGRSEAPVNNQQISPNPQPDHAQAVPA